MPGYALPRSSNLPRGLPRLCPVNASRPPQVAHGRIWYPITPANASLTLDILTRSDQADLRAKRVPDISMLPTNLRHCMRLTSGRFNATPRLKSAIMSDECFLSSGSSAVAWLERWLSRLRGRRRTERGLMKVRQARAEKKREHDHQARDLKTTHKVVLAQIAGE